MKRRFGSFFYKPASVANETPARPQRGFFSLAGGVLKKICVGLGALVLFSICMGILSAFILGGGPNLPDEMIATLYIDDAVMEVAESPSFSNPTGMGGLTVQSITRFFQDASKDKRVKGVMVYLNAGEMELAHIQEIRTAVKKFRKSGKPAFLYTNSFADLGSGIGAYYLATAFDQIWMQDTGMVSMTGISVEMPFARKILDKAGAKPEFLHREEYKSAMESFTNEQMSPANREMMESIVKNLSTQIFKGIVADRKIKDTVLQMYLDEGLVVDHDAQDAVLVDEIGTQADALEGMEAMLKLPEDQDYVTVDALDYIDATAKQHKDGDTARVALITISGEIVPGRDFEPGYATGDYIADAITQAADNEKIEVIVVRVDSPGGSPSASESIRAAIVSAKERGKKIIVSMGPLAASGGYWVSVDADKIFALPSTLTGSIGVIMGKFELSALWDKIGLNWDGVSWGENAGLWSPNKPLSAAERKVLNTAIDDTYLSFLDRVAVGRNMKMEDVKKIAKGRAWTGLEAKEIGLVDEIGGLDDALLYTAQLIGVKDATTMDILVLPEPMTPFEMILELTGQQVQARAFDTHMPAPLLKTLGPLVRQATVNERIGPVQVYDPALANMRY
jgi:protease IV